MKINNYINIVHSINLFQGFTLEELYKIFTSSKYEIRKYGKEEIIHLKNELCNSMDIILKGKVTIQNIDEDGNVLTIGVFNEGDSIGTNLIFSKRNFYPMTIISTSGATLLHINRELIIDLCQKNIDFMSRLLQEISDRSIILTDKISAISLKTIRQCIIDFIKYEHHEQNGLVINLSVSKKELAEKWGIQRSSLSRELNKMRKDGLLEYDAKTITIKCKDLLK